MLRSRDFASLTKKRTDTDTPREDASAPKVVKVTNNSNTLFAAPTVTTTVKTVPLVTALFNTKKLHETNATIFCKKASEELTEFFHHLETKFSYKADEANVLQIYDVLTKKEGLYIELKSLVYDLHQYNEMQEITLDLTEFLNYAFENPKQALDAAQVLVRAKNSLLASAAIMKTTSVEGNEARKAFLKDNVSSFCEKLNKLAPVSSAQLTK